MPFLINQKLGVIFADFLHPQAKKLAERLSELTKLERLFFSDNGSLREVALKMPSNHGRGDKNSNSSF